MSCPPVAAARRARCAFGCTRHATVGQCRQLCLELCTLRSVRTDFAQLEYGRTFRHLMTQRRSASDFCVASAYNHAAMMALAIMRRASEMVMARAYGQPYERSSSQGLLRQSRCRL